MDTDRPVISNGHGGQRLRQGGGGVERLLTLRELAEALQVSETTVRRLVARRRIPCIRLGRVLRFSPADLLRFTEALKE